MFKVTPFTQSLIVHFPGVRKLQQANNNCLSVLRLLWKNWLRESSSILVSAKDRFRERCHVHPSAWQRSPAAVAHITLSGNQVPGWQQNGWHGCFISGILPYQYLRESEAAGIGKQRLMRFVWVFRKLQGMRQNARGRVVCGCPVRGNCVLSWNGRHQHPHRRCTTWH